MLNKNRNLTVWAMLRVDCANPGHYSEYSSSIYGWKEKKKEEEEEENKAYSENKENVFHPAQTFFFLDANKNPFKWRMLTMH